MNYFDIFPIEELDKNSIGFDMGCGSGRWAKFIANKVGTLNCIDPSKQALEVAKRNLSEYSNVNFMNVSVGDRVLEEKSQDFGYCLGVLHHVPDTLSGIKSCAIPLKENAPFLIYLYYNFENRSFLFKWIWKLSDLLRRVISVLPSKAKVGIAALIALLVYFPLARFSLIVEKFGVNVFSDMKKGLKECDIVMMLRLQNERMTSSFLSSNREYYEYYGLTQDKLSCAKDDALIMHPGPMNRGIEIDTNLADDINRSVIKEQVELGVAVRMACLKIFCEK